MNVDYLIKSIEENEMIQKKNQKKKFVKDKLLQIVKQFIVDNKLICYGGTAINDLLPKEYQFYNYDVDIPDYDFFSPNAIEDAKKLCNLMKKENVYNIEAKSAFVHGTYKVFVNFVAIADITQVHASFYDELLKNAKQKDNLLYTSPNYLKMSLHQELARPLGDVERWKKIYNRLVLFNNNFPVSVLTKNKMENYNSEENKLDLSIPEIDNIYTLLFKYFKSNNAIFCNFDIIIRSFYKYTKHKPAKKNDFLDIFIVYSDNLNHFISEINQLDIPDLEVKKIKSIYKFVDNYAYLYYNDKLIGFIFSTNSCLSYNTIRYNKQDIRIGNLDTILNLYFTLILIDIPINRACVLEVIHKLQHIIINYDKIITKYESVSRIPDKLKRFNLPCYGNQDGRQEILKERSKKFKQYKTDKSSKKYIEWFFKYSPVIKKTRKKRQNKDKDKTKDNQ